MKLKIKSLLLSSLALSLFSNQSHAFNVDKMVVVSDDKGNGIITLFNDEKVPIFIETEVEEVQINDGVDIVKKQYKRENLQDWKISLTYQKLVLKPGEEKDIGIRSLCHNTTCDNSKDLIFMLSFIPSKYKPNEEEISGVDINYGFSPVYIIPTTEPKFDYKIKNLGDKLSVENDSNTMINILVDSCEGKVTAQCRQKFTAVAGRHKTFSLSENVQRDDLNITVSSHDRSYSKADVIKRSQ
ncbi:hypothetical protein ACPV47_24430 [Vibrio jasicida]|uniref:hypothetical protein n=1 Tax=Vibrio jasicida TaxID=766224 RepID=UPI0040694369